MRALTFLLFWLAGVAAADEPGEMLDDPVLEARAREIGEEVRCLVCRSESIEASNADFARDLRLVVRERIAAGDTDAEVRAFLVERFGEYVLMRPKFGGATLILWLLGPALLLLGAGFAFAFVRRSKAAADAPLSADEEARLKKLMGED